MRPAQVRPVDDLVWLCRGRDPRAGSTRLIAVDGPSGSGKSTLAARLAARLACPLIHMDDLYPGWDGLEDAVPRLMEWVVEPLAAGMQARYRRFDWPTGQYAEWHDVPPADVVVVEGVASGSRSAAPRLSVVVWVEAAQAERFRRGIERDGEGYRPHWQRWAIQEDRHFAAEGTRERADVIVDGELDGAAHAAQQVRVLRWPPGAAPTGVRQVLP